MRIRSESCKPFAGNLTFGSYCDALLALVDQVFPIDPDNVQRAKTVLLGKYRLSARDAIHLAVMEQHGVERILSFDQRFGRYPNVRRLTSA